MEKESKEQKVWINLSETIKTGDYENVKIEAGFSQMYTAENPIAILESGIDELREIIKVKAKRIRKKRKD